MNIYIAGGGGMLGKAVYEHFSKEHRVMVTDIRGTDGYWEYADVRNYHQQHWRLSEFRPNVIMNLAAETDLEYCEGHGEEAMSTNCGGSAVLATLADKFNAKYVYISTAGIFDGSKEKFTELDEPRPLSIYGKAKFYGEMIALTMPRNNSLVVRPGWMMGGGPFKDHKFINKVFKQIAAGSKEIFAVTDKAGTPTYTNDLAKQIDMLLQGKRIGLYNTTCLGSTNRYEVAKEFVRLLGMENTVKVTEVPSGFFMKDFPAQRPRSEVLDTRKLEGSGLCVMRDWKECLAEYVQEFK
jgi:dTDP-4-dehydrorhamnose reductase